MKADISLSERQRLEAEDQLQIRAALVRRHSQLLEEQHAIEGVQMALDIRGPEFRALAERMRG